MKFKKIVGVYGPGTVGKRIIHALLKVKNILEIDEIIVFKKTPDEEYLVVLEMMAAQGAKFAFEKESIKSFTRMGIKADYERSEALTRVNILIDCSAEGIPSQNKKEYADLAPQCSGFICQGAEKDRGFGKGPFIYGVNDGAFNFAEDRWLQVGSCNTHACSFLLKTIVFPEEIKGIIRDTGFIDAHFNLIRRSLDLNQKSKTVLSTEISNFSNSQYGTHHAEDVAEVFKLKGEKFNLDGRITSSAIKINEPYFHAVNFSFTFDRSVSREEITARLSREQYILFSRRRLANYVFQVGNDYGFMGRFSHSVIIVNYNVFPLADRRWRVVGNGFTPQDGNFLLSNLAAVTGYLAGDSVKQMPLLEKIFLKPNRQI